MTNRFEWLNEWWCKIDLLLLFLATTTTRNNITKNLGYNLIEYWRKNNKTKTEKKLSTLSSNRLSVNQLDESIGLNKYWLMEVEKNYNMLIIIHLRHRIFFPAPKQSIQSIVIEFCSSQNENKQQQKTETYQSNRLYVHC